MEYEGTQISEKYTSNLEDSAINAMNSSANKTVKVNCKANNVEQGVSIWQWISTSNDQSSKVLTDHTVCRYGDLFNTEPACPYSACANDDCSVCADDWKA